MKFFTAAWYLACNEAINRSFQECENPVWDLPSQEYAKHLHQLEGFLPPHVLRFARYGAMHDGVVLAVSHQPDSASMFVAVDRGEDQRGQVVEIVEVTHKGLRSLRFELVNEPAGPATPLVQDDWPPSAMWLYDEMDLSEAVPHHFVHRVLMQRRGAGDALLEIQFAFSELGVRSAPMVAFPLAAQSPLRA